MCFFLPIGDTAYKILCRCEPPLVSTVVGNQHTGTDGVDLALVFRPPAVVCGEFLFGELGRILHIVQKQAAETVGVQFVSPSAIAVTERMDQYLIGFPRLTGLLAVVAEPEIVRLSIIKLFHNLVVNSVSFSACSNGTPNWCALSDCN